jgi:predicted ATPase/DNA-binding CsgD family transcriptional regulator
MNATPLTVPFLYGPPASDPFPDVPPSPPNLTIGREREIQHVIELIDRDNVRLVTLLGPGGIGKTRLAYEVTRTLAPAFAHGARVVALDAVRDPALVPTAVAHALGFSESGERTAADLMGDLLVGQHMLLVLDNMEQVVGAATPWLSGLLRRAPRLNVLVTSRIPLNIDGEHQFLVPPLETPVTDPGTSAAVRLFAERARAVRHDFAIDEQNVDAIAEICRSLDGLPLAIELAAARIKILSPEALLARLTNRLTLLTGGHHDTPLRLRSMREAIGWSYDLLAEEERQLFRRLSVFLGGFTLDAAEFVAAWPCPSGTGRAPLDVLQSLVDQSLVQPFPTQDATRYRMLETIREYGMYQIEQHHTEDAHMAHAEYILDLARRAEPELTRGDQARWLDRLDAELANIRSAVAWFKRNGRVDDAIAVFASVILFVDVRGHVVEVLQHLERWLELPELQESTRSRGLVLYATGLMLHYMGDFPRGSQALKDAKAILLETGDLYHAAIAGSWGGVTYAFMGDDATAMPLLEESVTLGRESGNHRALALGHAMLGGIGRAIGDERLYRSSVDEAARIARQHSDWWMVCYTDLTANYLDALDGGRYADAETHIRESMRIRTMIGSKRDLPADWSFLAWAAYKQGNLERAADYVATAFRIAEETDHGWFQAITTYESAVIATEQGDLRRAQSLLAPYLGYFQTHHHTGHVAFSLATYGMIASLAGDAEAAARFLGAAEVIIPDPYEGRPEPGFWMIAWGRRPQNVAALPKRDFDIAYAEGAAWTIDEAISEALRYVLPTPIPAQDVAEETPVPGGLSPRELDVLAHMANGMSNRQIADALFVSHRTVTTHVTHIMTKLEVASRTAAVSFAIRSGIA